MFVLQSLLVSDVLVLENISALAPALYHVFCCVEQMQKESGGFAVNK